MLMNSELNMYYLCHDSEGLLYAIDNTKFKFRESAYVIIVNRSRKLFLVQNSLSRKWDFPGGAIDAGEEKEAAALREMEEETGLKSPKQIDYLFSTKEYYWHNQNDDPWRSIRHYFYTTDTDFLPQATRSSSEVIRAEFVDIGKQANDLSPSVIPVASVAFRHIEER